MARRSRQVSELIEKALALPPRQRRALLAALLAQRDQEPAKKGVEAAWDKEIKSRVDGIRSGRVKRVDGEKVLRWFAELDKFGPEPFDVGERIMLKPKKKSKRRLPRS